MELSVRERENGFQLDSVLSSLHSEFRFVKITLSDWEELPFRTIVL